MNDSASLTDPKETAFCFVGKGKPDSDAIKESRCLYLYCLTILWISWCGFIVVGLTLCSLTILCCQWTLCITRAGACLRNAAFQRWTWITVKGCVRACTHTLALNVVPWPCPAAQQPPSSSIACHISRNRTYYLVTTFPPVSSVPPIKREPILLFCKHKRFS